MARLSKQKRLTLERVQQQKVYSVIEAIMLLKSLPERKFKETIEVSINLGVDTRKSDQTVRGSVVLPQGTGRIVRVAVLAQGAQAEAAKNAGADQVGFEDLAADIKTGAINFEVLIATKEAMPLAAQLGPLLGPRGLMPNPKLGTVTEDVAAAVHNARSQVNYRADKGGVVHALLGKIDFSPEKLKQNLQALLEAVKKGKPAAAKGTYFKKITLSSTMGPGLLIEPSSLGIEL